MPCENCRVQFTIFKRKKSCTECRRLYCLGCLVKSREKSLCGRCVVFTKRPLSRIELQKLKPKDLIFYLQSKHISTAGCVEKEELVNLVLAHASTSAPSVTTSNSNNSNTPNSGSSNGTNFETNFRSYINSFSQNEPPRQGQRNSNAQFQDDNTSPFIYLKQGCQLLFDNLSDKISTNFKFDVPSNSGNASTSSGANSGHTSPRTEQPAASPPHPPSRSSQVNPTPTVPIAENLETGTEAMILVESESGSRGVPQLITRPNNDSHRTVLEGKRKLRKAFLEDALLSSSGCECSDDEESRQRRAVSQSTSNLLSDIDVDFQAGPSGINASQQRKQSNQSGIEHSSSSISNMTNTMSFSSFEELGAVGGSGETNSNGDFVKKKTTAKSSTKPNNEVSSDSFKKTDQHSTKNPQGVTVNRHVTRRRSDSCLSVTQKGILDENPGISTTIREDVSPRTCCDKCGKTKNQLKKRLKRFHDQLKEMSSQDHEIRQHLEAILKYLENKRLSSIELLSNDESDDNSGDQGGQGHSRVTIGSYSNSMVSNSLAAQDPNQQKIVYKRRFIKLDDIHSNAELEYLSVKQLKEILMLNRVDFKGCCEKNELIERVSRLWNEYNSCPSIEKLPSDDLCKICMDAPIECVILECGHLATCTNCGKVLSECPICRQYIVRVVRFFRA